MPTPSVLPQAVSPELRDAILAWYDASGRTLSFRGSDPYGVLVSELMAQQTQISRVHEAWTRWMTRFPTVEALAAAPLAEVLREWAGLGYNRRAVNLHRAAQAIVRDHAGRVPDTVEGLQALPGVGPYTARAVAAIAFGRPVGAVDTNVRRVLARSVAGAIDALDAPSLQVLADASVPRDRPAAWTHALMDIGATFCRPRAPRCEACPAARWCAFVAAGGPAREAAPRARPREGTAPRFTSTTRWLRGRIVERLRERDGWLTFDDAIGEHELGAVRRALATLARDGVIELDATGTTARLPVS